MNYEVELGSRFKREFKRLNKKYHSLVNYFDAFILELKANPETGADLGNGIRKVRMAISSKGKGKSHGARVITYTTIISVEEGVITLLTIYDKAEQESILTKEIAALVKEITE